MDVLRGKIMNIKVYHFKYSNFSDRFVNGLFSFCANLATPVVAFIVIAIAMGLCGITKYLTVEFMMVLLAFSVLLGIICAIKYCFGFKGITLYDSYLEITTQNMGLGKEKPKIKINYSDVVSVYHSTFNLRYDRKKAKRTFLAGDLTDYVELTLKGGKQFCFTVERQEEFLDEMIHRIDAE